MAKKMKKYAKSVFYASLTLLIFSSFANVCFAVHQEFEAIRELQEMEKSEPREFIEIPEVEYTADGMRNPFQGYIEQKEIIDVGAAGEEEMTLPSFTVQGVVWGGVPQAIVNDKIVKAGDMIDEAKIIEISKKGITVLYHDRRYNIMSPSAVTMENLEQALKTIEENKTLRGGQNE